MLQVAHIRENKEKVIEGLKKRRFPNSDQIIEEVVKMDQMRRTTQGEYDDVLAKSNEISKQIGQLMQQGLRGEAEKAKADTSTLKSQAKELSNQLGKYEEALTNLLYQIPNVPNEHVPHGAGENDNEVVYESAKLPELPASAKPHWELIKDYDIIDFDLGVKVTGAGFPVYKGQGARLQRALINFFLDEALALGYKEIQPPILINEASGYGTGQLPDKDGQMYHVGEDHFYIIPTAEVPITNLYREEILESKHLPVRHVGYTPCFRREAGSWGAHVRGLNRLHQFDKVEIVHIEYPENSYKALDEMCEYVRRLLEKLELPYRVLNLCGGDLGITSAQTFDMEVFSGAQKKWLEVSSVSNFETYQTNRLKLRYRDDKKKTQLLHTLNGSALALPRIVAALLENNQQEDHILVPEVLQHYTGFERIER